MNVQGKMVNSNPAISMAAQVYVILNKYTPILQPQPPQFTVNCGWDQWNAWESCSVTCGGGSQQRNRAKTQEALFGGNECTGSDFESQLCNNNGCPGRHILFYDMMILSYVPE